MTLEELGILLLALAIAVGAIVASGLIIHAAGQIGRDAVYGECVAAGYDKVACELVARKQVWIGMTAEHARWAWGWPTRINRTTTAAGVTEQWVYAVDETLSPTTKIVQAIAGEPTKTRYLYFQDGILTAIQD